MSDNESFESQTKTEGSIDNEDIAEQSSVVQPNQFEPVADSDTTTTEDGILLDYLDIFKQYIALSSDSQMGILHAGMGEFQITSSMHSIKCTL